MSRKSQCFVTAVFDQHDNLRPNAGDVSPLHLHHESLLIPPPVVINHTVINGLDELYQFYDRQLSAALDEADSTIDQIEVTSETTVTEYIAYVACALSIVNLIVFCIACRCFHRLAGRQFGYQAPQSPPVHVFHVQLLLSLARFAKIIQARSQDQSSQQQEKIPSAKGTTWKTK